MLLVTGFVTGLVSRRPPLKIFIYSALPRTHRSVIRSALYSVMSWDSYIENLIAQTKDASGNAHCDKACIIGMDGSQWTTAGHANALKLQGSEVVNIGKCFKNKDFTPFMATGVRAEGQSYLFLREEDGKIVYAKQKERGSISLQASKTAVVIGHCPEGGQQGNLNKGVAVIAEYLESLNM